MCRTLAGSCIAAQIERKLSTDILEFLSRIGKSSNMINGKVFSSEINSHVLVLNLLRSIAWQCKIRFPITGYLSRILLSDYHDDENDIIEIQSEYEDDEQDDTVNKTFINPTQVDNTDCERMIKCDTCDFQAKSKSEINTHKATSHNWCEFCFSSFISHLLSVFWKMIWTFLL